MIEYSFESGRDKLCFKRFSSFLVVVFPYTVVPEVGTVKPALADGFYLFVPGGLTISFDTISCLLLFCSILISGGPVL
jgi:hypothetical protein